MERKICMCYSTLLELKKKVTMVSVTRVQDLWVLIHDALHCPTTTEQLNGTYTNIYSSAKWLVLVQYHWRGLKFLRQNTPSVKDCLHGMCTEKYDVWTINAMCTIFLEKRNNKTDSLSSYKWKKKSLLSAAFGSDRFTKALQKQHKATTPCKKELKHISHPENTKDEKCSSYSAAWSFLIIELLGANKT